MPHRSAERVALVTSATFALCVASALGLLNCGRRNPRTLLADAIASSGTRPVFLRISGTEYAPQASRKRGTAPPDLRMSAVEVAAHGVLSRRSELVHEVDGLHAVAVAALLTGKEPMAVGILQDLAARQPSRSAVWNDLAIALHEDAIARDDGRSLGTALAAADRALVAAPNALEPLFNRAAVLETLGIRAAALDAWEKYCLADLEPHSPWVVEARQRIENLTRPTSTQLWAGAKERLENAALAGQLDVVEAVLRAFPRDTRSAGESLYLSTWGEAWLARRADAARFLNIARVTGERLLAVNGERLLFDAVIAVDHAIANGFGDDAARAYITYRDARFLVRDRKPNQAGPKLQLAEKQFRSIGSPMALVARYYRAAAIFDERAADDARTLLDDVASSAPAGYLSLRAQVLWERARIAARQGKSFEAFRDALAASALFDRLGEREFEARTRAQAASSLTRLGRPTEAWNLHRRNFRIAAESGSISLQEASLHAAFQDEIFCERHDVARAIGDVLLSLPSDNAILRFDVFLWRTFLDQTPRAANRMTALRAAADAIADNALREDARDQANLAEGMLLRKSAPTRAMPLLDASIDFNARAGRLTRLRDAYVVRAHAHRALHDDSAAESDLLRAISIREQQRRRIEQADLRDAFFGSGEQACRTLVDIYSRREAYDLAFTAAERCRGRSFRDDVTPVPEVDAVLRALPARTTLIHYTVFDDSTLALVLRAGRTMAHRVPVGRRQLSSSIDVLHRAIAGGDDETIQRIVRELSVHLLPFLADVQTAGDRLIVVADEPLTRVPFALLENPHSHAPLVASHPIVMAPSASGIIADAPRRPFAMPRRALAIGDPAFDTDAVRFPRLPHAAAEAREIAKMYPVAVTLIGADATITNVTQELALADVVHVGTHAMVSSSDALTSGLILTPTSGDDGFLYLRSLFHLNLKHRPLIVLAGCSTAAAGGGQGQIRSLAHVFLAAGSRDVIASLWDVDDRVARVFSIGFHHRLAAGRSPADALRDTQLLLKESADLRIRAPAAWAGFQVIGTD